jgi:NTE family protein
MNKKFLYDYIIINLPQNKSALSFSIILQSDFIINLSKKNLDYIPKLYNEKIRIIYVDLEKEKQLNRIVWYIGHLSRVISKRTIGLALGSGTVGGLAHIGVLKYLEEKKIPIDMIVGCSGGALYGALWAYKKSYTEVYSLVKKYTKLNFFDFGWSLIGFSNGHCLKNIYKKIFENQTFLEQSPIPIKIIATDLTNNNIKTFDSGDLWPAIRASISIPILFSPLKINRDYFADGNIVNPLPVDILKQANMDKTIAVYSTQKNTAKRWTPHQALDVYLRARTITTDKIALSHAQQATIFINPDVSRFSAFDYKKITHLVNIGYFAAKKGFENNDFSI